MIIRSTDSVPTITPISGMAWHYVWELLEFGVFKNGYASHAYSTGKHGGIERVRRCLADTETAFGYGHGELHARIWRMRLDDNETVLAAEQFVHSREANQDDKAMLYDKRWLAVGGKSEFYFCDQKTALARFANSYRKTNLAIGGAVRDWKREKGIHGCPLPRDYEIAY